MPRDATATREALLSEAERLFAERGVAQTTTREIVRAAGQSNSSALTYHFGSREGLLRALLRRHEEPLDAERGRLLDGLPSEGAPTRELVGVLLRAYARPLADRSGRRFLRIVAQLTEAFPAWSSAAEGPNLRRVLALLAAPPPGVAPAVRGERVVAMIALMTSTMAGRAAAIDHGREPELDQTAFLANLADMIVGLLDAPVGPPLDGAGDAPPRPRRRGR